jgi:hypothetical protein
MYNTHHLRFKYHFDGFVNIPSASPIFIATSFSLHLRDDRHGIYN